MRLNSPVLVTKDLSRLRSFYADVLGLQVKDDFGGCIVLGCGLSLWQPGEAHPVQPPADVRDSELQGHPFELCFEADTVDEFDSMAQSLIGVGLPLLHPVREEPWGQRTLRLLDPDGNLVEWGESIPCFVRRLYQACSDEARVARTTGVAIEEVRRILGSAGS